MVKYVLAIFGGNLILSLSILAWAVAQVSKFFVNLATSGNRDWHYLLTGGGMPSSHSATVCSLTTAAGICCGVGSSAFAISFVLAMVVMYDAMGVRRETGKQAKLLNFIMLENPLKLNGEILQEKLKEYVGHTPLQVVAGAILGIGLTFLLDYWFY